MQDNNLLELEELYLEAKKAYYSSDAPIMSDDEFDKLEETLRSLNSDKISVGFEDKNTNKEYHITSMLSLAKTQVRSSILDIQIDIESFLEKSHQHKKHLIEGTPKLDGNAINTIYINGVYEKAITRGNKVRGTNVTEKIRPLVPQKIDLLGTVEIRGEVIMPDNIFESKYSHLYKNSRNFIAGFINRKVEDNVIDPILLNKEANFVPFEVRVQGNTQGWSFLENSMFWLKKSSFDTVEPYYIQNFEELTNLYNKFENERPTFKYRLDGLVLKMNESIRHIVGEDSTTPKWALAIKFPPKEIYTVINDISWKTGTTGEVFPVGLLEPVDLDGSTVKRVSMYNYGWVKKNKCFIGAQVQLVKSGDIIPQIVKVSIQSSTGFTYPENCPSCKAKLHVDEDHLICVNLECEAQALSKFSRWINGLDIDSLGGATIKLLYAVGITSPEKFIENFNREYLIKSGYFKAGKSLDKILAGWENLKEIDGFKIVYSFGVNNAGNTISKQIAYFYNNLPHDFFGLEKKIVEILMTDTYKDRYFHIQNMLISKHKNVVVRSTGHSTSGKTVVKVELTGSPKTAGFKTKELFLQDLNSHSDVEYQLTDLKEALILITDDLTSTSSKMKYAQTKGIEVKTYLDFLNK